MFKKISSSEVRILPVGDTGRTMIIFNEDILLQASYIVNSGSDWYSPQIYGQGGNPFYPGIVEQMGGNKFHDNLFTRQIEFVTPYSDMWIDRPFEIIVFVNP